MKILYTADTLFSFEGPNLCLLGNKEDFKTLAKAVEILASYGYIGSFSIINLPGFTLEGPPIDIVFSAKAGAITLGEIVDDTTIKIELDPRYWERLFLLFVKMSWEMSTYYLNFYESYFVDFPELSQNFNFICSSEFGDRV